MASENVYAAPQTDLTPPDIAVPDDILKKIKTGWVVALISAALTLVLTGIAINGTSVMGFTAWNGVDALIALALAFGIYKKSRVCAVIMLVYFMAAKLIMISQTGRFDGIVMAVVFLVCYFQAVMGTFAYHRFIKDAAQPGTQ